MSETRKNRAVTIRLEPDQSILLDRLVEAMNAKLKFRRVRPSDAIKEVLEQGFARMGETYLDPKPEDEPKTV